MITRIDKPEVFSHLEGGAWFELSREGEAYGYMALMKRCPNADVHIEVTKWGHNALKHLKASVLPELKEMCRVNGVEKLVAKKMAGDSRWPKFIKHFGFSEPECIMASYLEI